MKYGNIMVNFAFSTVPYFVWKNSLLCNTERQLKVNGLNKEGWMGATCMLLQRTQGLW